MKKYSLIVLTAIVLTLSAASTATAAAYVEVTLAPLSRSHRPPSLGRRQGWLTVSNRDWQSYTLVASKGKIYVYRDGTGRRGGVVIPSGTTMTIALEKDNYDVYGSSADKMRVKIREGKTSTLSLEPFGRRGQSGLRVVISDGGSQRRGDLFDAYVSRPSPNPHPQAKPHSGKNTPPPPSVIVNRPPVVNQPSSKPSPAPGKPGSSNQGGKNQPAPGKPGAPGKSDGWGSVYGGR